MTITSVLILDLMAAKAEECTVKPTIYYSEIVTEIINNGILAFF